MGRRINLVPQSERTRTNTDVGMLALLAVVVIVIFAVGLGYYVLSGRLDSKEQELADIRQQVAQLESQVAALDQYARLSAERERTEVAIQKIYAGRTLVADVLDTMSLVIPEDAWFQSLNLQTAEPVLDVGAGGQGTGVVEGQAGLMTVEGNTYSFEGVAQVLVRLKLIPTLNDVVLLSAGQPRGETDPAVDVKGYTITASVVNDQPADMPLPMSQAEVIVP